MKNENPKSYPDRINLSAEQSAKVQVWQKQIEVAFQGALKLGRSDLVNFILGTTQETLSKSILSRLFDEHFDEIRFLTWARSKILEAKREGRTLTLDNLKENLLSDLVSSEPMKVFGKRSKKAVAGSTDTATDLMPQASGDVKHDQKVS